MILAIDIGNTSTNIGLFNSKGKLEFLSELETDKKKTQDQCCIDLTCVFQLYRAEISAVKGAILSSVVPPMTENMAAAIARLTGRRMSTTSWAAILWHLLWPPFPNIPRPSLSSI